MPEFFSFFIILLAAVLFSNLFTRMRVPWVVALITGGVIIGPYGLGLFEPDPTINFLAGIGLVFLMFMAGLETKLSDIRGLKGKIFTIAFLSGAIPAFVGISIGLIFGYPLLTSILLGIVFMASSIALLIPSLQAQYVLGSQLGKIILGATVAIDFIALVLLSIFLQLTAHPSFSFVLIFYPLIILFFALFLWIIPKIRKIAFNNYAEEHDLFEKELRFIILILIGMVVVFEFIGLHAILAGFFAGLVLSQSVQSKILKAKLHAMGYGFFIPVFFVILGSNTNIWIFKETGVAFVLVGAIIIGALGSKFISGWLGGKIIGLTKGESAFLGSATIPSLSTTLAIAYLGASQGFFDQQLLASIVILGVVTSIVAPILVKKFSKNVESHKVFLETQNH